MYNPTQYSTQIKSSSSYRGLVVLSIMLFVILTSALSGYTPAWAKQEVEEHQIKAGYIYRFTLFVKWPEKDAPSILSLENNKITIGILGEDPFKDFFADVEGKPVPRIKKNLEIKRFGPFRQGLAFNTCHVLFISTSEQDNLSRIFASLKDVPILTVGDMDNFCDMGGIINLVTIGERVRFEVNLSRARQIGLSISSNLLRAALRVIQADEPNP